MTITQMASVVGRWFEQAGHASGPILPDGWFGGRAYNSIFFLVDVQALDEQLVIHLSEDTTLDFVQPRRVYVENSDLVFADYDSATLRRKNYGDPNSPYYEDTYDYGQVRLVVLPPGPTIVIAEEEARVPLHPPSAPNETDDPPPRNRTA